MKHLLKRFLAVVLVICTIATMVMPAYAEGETTGTDPSAALSLSAKLDSENKQIAVTVSLEEGANLTGAQARLNYDSGAVAFNSFKSEDYLPNGDADDVAYDSGSYVELIFGGWASGTEDAKTTTESAVLGTVIFDITDTTAKKADFSLTNGVCTNYEAETSVDADLSDPVSVTIRYDITAENPEQDHGSYTVDKTVAMSGETVTITPSPRAGYEVKAITVTGEDETPVAVAEDNSFVMPAQNVTVSVSFQAKTYGITVAEVENGEAAVTVNGEPADKASTGETVTITLTYNEGYSAQAPVVTYQALGEEGREETVAVDVTPVEGKDNTYTFIMPAGDVTVSATISALNFAITNGSDNVRGGTVTVKDNADTDEIVDITVSTAAGYTAGEPVVTYQVYGEGGREETVKVDVTAGEAEGTYTFKMPAHDVKVSVTFTAETYNITTTATEHGSFTVQATAETDETVAITVEPAAGYMVDQVTVKTASGETVEVKDNTFVMPASDVEVSVTFKDLEHDIVVTQPENGEISVQSSAVANAEVTITVTPKDGYSLVALDVQDENGNPVAVEDGKFTMPDCAVTISATFEANTYNITKADTVHGSFTVQETAKTDEPVTITVKEDDDYEVDQVTVKTASGKTVEVKDNTFVMPASDVEVSVTFQAVEHNIVVTQPENGEISVQSTAVTNEEVSITVTPKAGYSVTAINVEDDNGNPVTVEDGKFKMPACGVTVSATIEADSHSITVDSEIKNGSINVASSAKTDETVTLEPKAANGYEVETVTVNGVEIDADADGKYTFVMPAEDTTVSATFSALNFNITNSSDTTHGTVTVKETADTDEIVTITVSAAAGYKAGEPVVSYQANGEDGRVETVTVEVTAGEAEGTYTFKMPAHAVEVSVTFTAETYNITKADTEHGSFQVDSSAKTDEDVTIQVTPDAGYLAGQVTVTGAEVTKVNDTTYTFKMPAQDVTVSVTFELKQYLVKFADAENGTVTADQTNVAAGTEVTVTVTPDDGYEVESFSVLGVDGFTEVSYTDKGDGIYTFKMPTQDVTVTVTFVEKTYQITTAASSNGTISVDKNLAKAGETVTVTVTANSGYVVGGVSVNAEGVTVTDQGNGTYTFVMPAQAVTVSAQFKAIHTVSLTSFTNGKVSADPTATAGDTVTVTATPDPNYVVESVTVSSGAEVTTVNDTTYTFIMPDEDVTVTVKFTDKTFAVNVTAGANGTAEANLKAAAKGAAVTVTATPNSGYVVDQVTMNGTALTANEDGTYTFEMPAEEANVSVTFVAVYGVKVEAGANGTASADKTTAKAGEIITITAAPDEEYLVDQVTAGDAAVTKGENNTYTFEMPAEDVTVSVTFVKKTYGVSVTTDGNGTAEADKDVASKGDTVTVTVEPKTGYVVDQVTMNGTALTANEDGTYTFTMPGGEAKVSVTFQATYAVNVASASNGTIEVNKTTAVAGETITITATPANGYRIDTITVTDQSGKEVEVKNNSFVMPASDVTVAATFKASPFTITVAQDGNGTVDVQTGAATDETVTFTVTAGDGYTAGTPQVTYSAQGETKTVELKAGEQAGTYSFAMPAADVTISVAFTANSYTVSVEQAEHGTVTVDKASAATDSTVTITATPDEEYLVSEITVKTASGKTVEVKDNTFVMPAENVTVSAAFVVKTYAVNVDKAEHGTAAATPTSATKGETITVITAPDKGYVVKEVTVNGTPAVRVDENKYTFTMPGETAKVTVTYEALYTITVDSAIAHGTVTVDKTSAVAGELVTITVKPEGAYLVGQVTAGDAEVVKGENNTYTFTMPAKDVTVSASFALKTYGVAVAEAKNGQVKASTETAAEGDTITITATADKGYVVDQVTVKTASGKTVEVKDNTFVMPAEDVTVTVTFAEKTYQITTAAVSNGTVKVDKNTAKAGETVTVTVTANTGYVVSAVTVNAEGVTVTDKGNGTYTFVMPAQAVMVSASYQVENPFVDVKSSDWFYPYVLEAYNRGLMNGTGGNKFEPYGTTTRAMFVQILYAMAGKPEVTINNPFVDVSDTAWYAKAVQWAYENKVTGGTSDTTFSPDEPVTREQIALFLYAYAGRPEVSGDLSKFADSAKVSSWAKTAVIWATQNGIISGSNDNGTLYLNPGKSASRAETATMMVGFAKFLEK